MNAIGSPLQEAPWGTSIGIYFVLVGLSSGLTFMCWWVRPRDPASADRFEWVAGWSALLIMLVVCTVLVIDLGQPTRFLLMVTRFTNIGSPMSVGAKLISLKLGLLGAYLFLLRRRLAAHARHDQSLAPGATEFLYRAVPAVLGVVSLGLAIYPSVLLSRTWISPLATGPMTSLAFLSTALLMGAATTVLLGHVLSGVVDEAFKVRMARTLTFLICAQAIVLAFDWLSSPSTRAPLVSMGVFQIVVVTIGLALPLAIFLALPKHRLATMLGATASLVGAGVLRYLFFAVR